MGRIFGHVFISSIFLTAVAAVGNADISANAPLVAVPLTPREIYIAATNPQIIYEDTVPEGRDVVQDVVVEGLEKNERVSEGSIGHVCMCARSKLRSRFSEESNNLGSQGLLGLED